MLAVSAQGQSIAPMPMKAGEAAKVLRQHADAIGAVGQRRRQPKKQQQRKDQERPATGDDVECT